MPEKQPNQYERRDISARVVMWFAAGLIATGILSQVGIWVFRNRLEEAYPSPQAATRLTYPKVKPPAPQLQSDPARDLQELRKSEELLLHSYAWVDQKAGIIRIPIERAMELTVQRGLPVRGAPNKGASP